jgi:hypothetical protein
VSHASRSSQSPGLQVDDGGSVDFYFAPKVSDGRGSNWIPTNPSGDFEVLFRFYGSTPALYDKTWMLPDVYKL